MIHLNEIHLSKSVQEAVMSVLKQSQYFSLQLHESRDVAGQPLLTKTTGEEIFKCIDNFREGNEVDWSKCVGLTADGVRAMSGIRTGLVTQVKSVAPLVQRTHCSIHREALEVKGLDECPKNTLDYAVKFVNFIKARPKNSPLFGVLCDEMRSEHKQLFLHCEVQWLSRDLFGPYLLVLFKVVWASSSGAWPWCLVRLVMASVCDYPFKPRDLKIRERPSSSFKDKGNSPPFLKHHNDTLLRNTLPLSSATRLWAGNRRGPWTIPLPSYRHSQENRPNVLGTPDPELVNQGHAMSKHSRARSHHSLHIDPRWATPTTTPLGQNENQPFRAAKTPNTDPAGPNKNK
ncbi:Zinc finger BED domain-containing protein 5 [Araneus ventricosus]|uniref:Zinc finger BED domain-containing protein 5 n=1 Tax=Araneus ventricosus TaxID=182803 RepID=A0A4Y2INI8_ARAVE|nr:Zinc finger BED domain-containing protein 5 [Araneus ventricosus]